MHATPLVITAIDTDAGKTIVTGAIARYLLSQGKNVITQKMAQTGCTDSSDDIRVHRHMMGITHFPEDHEGLTCPYLFPFPCSPHLAASLVDTRIDPAHIRQATEILASRYEQVLVEGVGGLMVPLNDDTLLIDYLNECDYPLVLVTHAKLGSINHTLLSLDACARRGIRVAGLVFNHLANTDPIIREDTLKVFRNMLHRYYPEAKMVEMPFLDDTNTPVDFSALFGN